MRVLEGKRELLADQDGEVVVRRLGMHLCVAVHEDVAGLVVLGDDLSTGVRAEIASRVSPRTLAIQLRFVEPTVDFFHDALEHFHPHADVDRPWHGVERPIELLLDQPARASSANCDDDVVKDLLLLQVFGTPVAVLLVTNDELRALSPDGQNVGVPVEFQVLPLSADGLQDSLVDRGCVVASRVQDILVVIDQSGRRSFAPNPSQVPFVWPNDRQLAGCVTDDEPVHGIDETLQLFLADLAPKAAADDLRGRQAELEVIDIARGVRRPAVIAAGLWTLRQPLFTGRQRERANATVIEVRADVVDVHVGIGAPPSSAWW